MKPALNLGAWVGWSEWRNRSGWFDVSNLNDRCPSFRRVSSEVTKVASRSGNRGIKFMSALTQLFLIIAVLVSCSSAEPQAVIDSQQYQLRASHFADRSGSFQLEGAELLRGVFIFVTTPSAQVDRVEFFLGPEIAGGSPSRITYEAPFDLASSEDGRSRLWDVAELGAGSHQVRADIHLDDGSVHRARATFSVKLLSTQPLPEPSPTPQPAPQPLPQPTPPQPAPPKPTPPSAPDSTIWEPTPGTSWQWQLTGRIDTSVDAQVFDVDLFDVPVATIEELHRLGRRVICYFSGGSYEGWRPDQARFPAAVRGKKMDGWDEDWLDVRRVDLLAPVMRARLDLAAEKGCDAVEPDNVDGYQNDSGFNISYADQLAYNRFLAQEAHARGLAIGLKNNLEQISDLVDHFDFAVNEECFSWNECHMLTPFVAANKAVFGAEYGHGISAFCPVTNSLDLDFIRKDLSLGAARQSCR